MYSNAKIKTKMSVTYVTLSLIPFLLVSAISTRLYTVQTINTATNHIAQITQQVSDAIDLYISGLDRTLDFLSLQVQAIAAREGEAFWESDTLLKILEEIASSHPDVAGILIASESDHYISTDMARISRDPFTSEDWYIQARERGKSMILVSSLMGRNITTRMDYSVDDVFGLTKAVFSPEDGRCLGVIMVDVRHSIIRDAIDRVPLGERGFVFIIDSKGSIVYTPPNKEVYRIRPTRLTSNGKQPFEVNLNGTRWYICQSPGAYTDWKTVGGFSYDEVMGGVNTILLTFVLSIMAIVILLIFFSSWLSFSLTKPIFKLRGLMREAELGNMDVRFEQSGGDELGELGTGFNHMLSRIGELLMQIREEQRQRLDAEMKILQEQIKPHFLYNTLDSVSWMAREYEAHDIVRLVDALTTMFRIGLSTGKDFIPLRDEISHVSNYLYIQKIRYREKLSYRVDADPETMNCEVPKLILQPLVENAIYHGIKEKRGGGEVVIVAQIAAHALELFVADNGVGMTDETVRRLQDQITRGSESGRKPGFGLFYIQQRVTQYYGPSWGLTIASQRGQGTIVMAKLPIKETGND
jgi:two-component system sensor histidine kinase YesM